MKLIGSPISLCLRLAQSLFAVLLLIVSVLNASFYMFTVFRVLSAASFIQMVWGIGMCFYDFHVKRHINRRLDSRLLTVLVIGDWVVGLITLAGTSSAAAVMVYLAHDTDRCSFLPYECKMGAATVILAFCGWMCVAITALALFWFRASL